MQEEKIINLSSLGHTWILDLDGTIVEHNGYILHSEDRVLDKAGEFLRKIPDEDMIIIVTSRPESLRSMTCEFLLKNNIRYDHIIFKAPYGERIIMNDRKESGLSTAVAVNMERNSFELDDIRINYEW